MNRYSNWRLLFLLFLFLLLGVGVASRLFFLQILQHDYYSKITEDRNQLYQTLFPDRGEVFMQDLAVSRKGQDKYYPLAVNKEFKQVYLVPKDISEDSKDSLAEKLSGLLRLDKDLILSRINKKGDPYEPLKSKIDDEVVKQIEALNIKGVGLAPEVWRYYPNKSLASHIIGFVGMSNDERTGQYGIEGYYNKELQGEPGHLSGEKDIAGYWIPSLKHDFKPAEDGSKIILTIDQNIQFQIEKELNYLAGKWQAEEGTIIVMDAKTGAVRGMASYPNFDPNEYNKVENINVFLNPAIQKAYEPGSVFKVLTMAAGLENGKITPSATYIDKGEVRFGGSVIKNVDGKIYGEQTMTQVLEQSLNTGAIFVQQALGEELFVNFIQRFRFGELLGVDISGEVGGNISNLFTGRDVNLATISFGQGITVTPLSLIAMIGAVANKGNLMRPFLVQKIIKADGSEIATEPRIIDRVMSAQTSEKLTKMMVSVVENGHAKSVQVPGYTIAGKTGTAQVADLVKGGYSEDTIHTFVGFTPAFNPQFVMLIKLDKPKGTRFAEGSVNPSFKKLSEYLFNYLEIPPQ